MNKFIKFGLAAVLAAMAVAADDPTEEDKLIATLQGDNPPAKVQACARLKQIGTAKSTAALGALLTDTDLCYPARDALESIAAPQATTALALAKSQNPQKVAILGSLAKKRDRSTIPAVKDLAGSSDAGVAAAAMAALGRIGGPDALAILEAAKAKVSAELRTALADAMLMCAEALTDQKAAAAAYAKIQASADLPPHCRTAATRGLILASGTDAPAVMKKALATGDNAVVYGAVKAIQDMRGEAATKAIAAMLPKLAAPVQVLVIGILEQRGDVAAAPAVAAAAQSADAAVRLSALRAAGTLGDGSVVPILVKAIGGPAGAECDAAKDALGRLKGAAALQAILAELPKANDATRLVLIQAVGQRREPAAATALVQLALTGTDEAKVAALQAVALVADEAVAADLVKVIMSSKTDAVREEAEKALNSACLRSAKKDLCAQPIVAALAGADVPSRCALLRSCGNLAGAPVLKAQRDAIKSADAGVQDAGVRSLAGSGDPAALDDLLAIAGKGTNLTHKVLALRGVVRLVEEVQLSEAKKVDALKQSMAAAGRDEDKKLVLGGLARLTSPEALAIAEPLMADKANASEAMAACWQIINAIKDKHTAAAIPATRKIAESGNKQMAGQARALLPQLEAAAKAK